MWKEERAKNRQLTSSVGPDMKVRELFDLIDPSGMRRKDKDSLLAIGNEIQDKLSTGQLVAWGRPMNGPFVKIEEDYWREAGWTYYFLSDVFGPDVYISGSPLDAAYWDVHVSRAQVLRIWPSK
jgi:hypothetical protein